MEGSLLIEGSWTFPVSGCDLLRSLLFFLQYSLIHDCNLCVFHISCDWVRFLHLTYCSTDSRLSRRTCRDTLGNPSRGECVISLDPLHLSSWSYWIHQCVINIERHGLFNRCCLNSSCHVSFVVVWVVTCIFCTSIMCFDMHLMRCFDDHQTQEYNHCACGLMITGRCATIR